MGLLRFAPQKEKTQIFECWPERQAKTFQCLICAGTANEVEGGSFGAGKA